MLKNLRGQHKSTRGGAHWYGSLRVRVQVGTGITGKIDSPVFRACVSKKPLVRSASASHVDSQANFLPSYVTREQRAQCTRYGAHQDEVVVPRPRIESALAVYPWN